MPDYEIGDAFGNALLAHLNEGGTAGDHQIVRDDGYVDEEPGATYFDGEAPWHLPERAMAGLARGRVLDVGAGAGRNTLPLQEQGLDATALDVSPGAIDVCRMRGVEQVHLGEVDTLDPGERFDTFLLFGNNLGLIGSPDGAAEFLGPMRRRAADGAVLLGTTLDVYGTDNPDHLAYHEFNRQRGRWPGHITIRTIHRGVATPWHDLLFPSIEELTRVLEGSGWAIGEVFDEDDWFIYGVALRPV